VALARMSGQCARWLSQRAPRSRSEAREGGRVPHHGQRRAVKVEALTVKADDGLGVLRWSRDGALSPADGAPSWRNPCTFSQVEQTVEACEQRWRRWG
jgi:hypothetical protein